MPGRIQCLLSVAILILLVKWRSTDETVEARRAPLGFLSHRRTSGATSWNAPFSELPAAGRPLSKPGVVMIESSVLTNYIRQRTSPTSFPGRPILSAMRGRASVRSVGSRTGAPTLGSGGNSTAFAVALSPAAIITGPDTRAGRSSVCRAMISPLCAGAVCRASSAAF
jgi:hypothetical protein